MRYKIDGLRNGIDVTTTPEGFKFVYEQFVKAVREKTELASLYGLVQASTFDNEKNLPAGLYPSYLRYLIFWNLRKHLDKYKSPSLSGNHARHTARSVL